MTNDDLAEAVDQADILELATGLTVAWLSNRNTTVSAGEVPEFLNKVHRTVTKLATQGDAPEAEPEPDYPPAVTVRRSLASADHIISMIDGKPYKMLKRHLARHGLTPAAYRQRYGLKQDYPMVAPNYAEARRGIAQKIGLGRKDGQGARNEAAPTREKLSLWGKGTR